METTRAWRWWGLAGVLCLFAVVGCGGDSQPTERPSDCRGDEFFNDRTDRCRPCPAYEAPSCRSGCGFEIETDDNGCPMPVCDPECDTCGAGSFFDVETGRCQACPRAPQCIQFDCEGELRVTESFSTACPPPEAYACGACEHPSKGCVADGQGQCVDVSN